MGAPFELRKQETKNKVETSWFPIKAEVQRCPLSWGWDLANLLGYKKANFGT
jgi:hypothetical protein